MAGAEMGLMGGIEKGRGRGKRVWWRKRGGLFRKRGADCGRTWHGLAWDGAGAACVCRWIGLVGPWRVGVLVPDGVVIRGSAMGLVDEVWGREVEIC